MTLSTALRTLLDGFAGLPGQIVMHARSVSGIGRELLTFDPADRGVALRAPLLACLEGGWGIELHPATLALDGTPVALAYAFAVWRIPQDFGAATDWQLRPHAPAVDAAAAALRSFPCAPTFVIDGVTSISALWQLAVPLPLQSDGGAALGRSCQRQLAGRLGADPVLGEELRTRIPLPGSIVRNVGTQSPLPVVQAVLVAPERRYTVTELEAASAPVGVARRKGVSA